MEILVFFVSLWIVLVALTLLDVWQERVHHH
jgi:hypothetical protein